VELTAPPPLESAGLAAAQAARWGPVDAETGALTWAESDLAVPDAGRSLRADRVYRSDGPVSGPLGAGWRTSYSESLSDSTAGDVTTYSVGTVGGQSMNFAFDDGNYVPEPGVAATFDTAAETMSTASGDTMSFGDSLRTVEHRGNEKETAVRR
jgi:hypothetical protein